MKQYLVSQPIIVYGLLIFLNFFEIGGAGVVNNGKKSTLNFAVIGAGYGIAHIN